MITFRKRCVPGRKLANFAILAKIAHFHQNYFSYFRGIFQIKYHLVVDPFPLQKRRIRAIKVKKAPYYKKAPPPIRNKKFLGGGLSYFEKGQNTKARRRRFFFWGVL